MGQITILVAAEVAVL
jgi:hypothetical protein